MNYKKEIKKIDMYFKYCNSIKKLQNFKKKKFQKFLLYHQFIIEKNLYQDLLEVYKAKILKI